MSNFNKTILMGHITAQPEMRYTQTGKPVTTFTLAVNRPKYGDKESVCDFFTIVAFGKLAEFTSKYLDKGKGALVEGRLQVRGYTDRDNVKRKVYEIVADEVRLIGNGKPHSEPVPDVGWDKGGMDAETPAHTDEEVPF